MDSSYELFREGQELQRQLTETRELFFFNEVLFSFQWWLLLAALIGAYALFWLVADRSRLMPTLFLGALVYGVAVTTDSIGADFVLWDYPRMTLPWGPKLLAANFIIPIGYMLIYQWFREWRSYFAAAVALSAVYAFVLEPFASITNVYVLLDWRYVYSFPIFAALGLFVKWAADVAERLQRRQRSAA